MRRAWNKVKNAYSEQRRIQATEERKRLQRKYLALRSVPIVWSKFRIAFIPELDKNGHVKPRDYRPISLSTLRVHIWWNVLCPPHNMPIGQIDLQRLLCTNWW